MGLRRAHHIIAITDEEKEVFDRMDVPSCTVIGYMARMELRTPLRKESENRNFTFGLLGSKNLLNKASLDWLLQEVLSDPALEKSNFRINIGGNIADLYKKKKSNPRIHFLGHVDYDDFYDSADVILNPMLIGTGLKFKSC